MKKGQLTMKDIADKLGISKSTVSRALKNHPDISDETKKAVMQLAEELDFQPNSLALSLRHNKSFIIGVIVPEIVHDFFANVISGIQKVAYEAGYNVMICLSNENFEQEETDTRALLSSRVDGMMISVAKGTTSFDHLKKLTKKGIPLVFFDRACDEVEASKVISDDYDGAFKATEHLIEQGCKHIAHLAGPKNLTLSIRRKEGYKAALKKHGLQYMEDLVEPCPEGTIEEGATHTYTLLKNHPEIDGIFGNNDVAAIGAMKALKEMGKSIPDEVAVIGFSDWRLAALMDPPLSSVAQSGFEIGKTATEMLLEEINSKDENLKPLTRIVHSELMARESSIRSK